MKDKPIHTAERVSHSDPSDNYVFQRSLLAYHRAAEMVRGDVLEIGTGSGYGVEIIAPKVGTYTTIDKYDCHIDPTQYRNVEFLRMKVPPLSTIEVASVDFVVSFQVIEHIADDFALMAEVVRVLRPGGRLILTTPNKPMSLTRNPWHVREYSADELTNLLSGYFSEVQALGVFGNQKVMDYYEKNRRSVEKYAALDVLRLREWLPRRLLRLPYDIHNRLNRRRLLIANRTLTGGITMDDYRLAPVNDECFDLFFIATK